MRTVIKEVDRLDVGTERCVNESSTCNTPSDRDRTGSARSKCRDTVDPDSDLSRLRLVFFLVFV